MGIIWLAAVLSISFSSSCTHLTFIPFKTKSPKSDGPAINMILCVLVPIFQTVCAWSSSLSSPFNPLLFVDRQRYWSRNAEFELCRLTSSREVKLFAGWDNFSILSEAYFISLNCWGEMEPSHLLVVLSTSVSAWSSHLVSGSSSPAQALLWRIAMCDSLVFFVLDFAVEAPDCIALSETTDLSVLLTIVLCWGRYSLGCTMLLKIWVTLRSSWYFFRSSSV